MEQRFYNLVILSFLIAYSPFRALALIYPFIFILLLITYVGVRSRENFIRFIIVGIVYLFLCLIYWVINKDFLWFNSIFFFITISPFILLVFDLKGVATQTVIFKVNNFILKFCFFQAIVGIIQIIFNAIILGHGFDKNTGDAVHGTITLSLLPDNAGSNAMFAILQSSLLVLYFFINHFLKKRMNKFYISVILISWILGSVMHTIILWIFALVITNILMISHFKNLNKYFSKLIINKKKIIRSTIISILAIISAMFIFLSENISGTLPNIIAQTFTSDINASTTKVIATVETFTGLDDDKPYQSYFGIGPGQYSSRASLIVSGKYLVGGIPFEPSISPDLNKYILPLWEPVFLGEQFYAGSSYFPFYSWLSTYGEFGFMGLFFVAVFLIKIILKQKKYCSKVDPLIPFAIVFICIYIYLLGFQDNYWEWSQPMMPIILLTKLCYNYTKNEFESKVGLIYER